jgi:hypothetical protein
VSALLPLLEAASRLAELEALAAEYLAHMGGRERAAREFGADLATVCSEPGNCAMVSDHLASWLAERGVAARLVTGHEAVDPAWAARAGVRPGSEEDAHTAVRVGGWVVDLTARQFDPRAPLPRVEPLAAWAAEWRRVD